MTFPPFDLSALFNSLLVIAAVVVAVMWARSKLTINTSSEFERLADARGDRIGDLESQLASLRDHVKMLDGQMLALQALKATEIADAVVTALAPMMRKQ